MMILEGGLDDLCLCWLLINDLPIHGGILIGIEEPTMIGVAMCSLIAVPR